MKWLRSAIALACAGACVTAALRLSKDDHGLASPSTPLVAPGAIDPERVYELTIERQGARHRFVLRPDGWWQVEPIELPADGWAIRQLVTRAIKAEAVRMVGLAPPGEARDAELSRAGLAPPTAALTLRQQSSGDKPEGAASAGNAELRIELGRRSLAGRAYARVVAPAAERASGAGENYAVVDAGLHEFAVDRDLREFRRRDLFPGLAEVSRVRLVSGAGETVLVREGSAYRLESPIRARADRAKCEEYLDALRRAKSGGFIVDTPADASVYGLDPALATVEVTVPGGAMRALRIGEPVSIGAQDRFGALGHAPAVVRLPAEVLAGIVPRIERLVDGVASGVKARDVGALDIVLPERRLSLRREIDGWSARVEPIQPTGGPDEPQRDAAMAGTIDSAAVERLLSGLCEARAGAVEIAAYPAQDGRALVTLRGFGGEALDTVRIAVRASDGRTILENGDGVLRLHGEIDLPLDPASLGFSPLPPAAGTQERPAGEAQR